MTDRWRLRTQTLDLTRRPLWVGILNATPDSFSDGGRFGALRPDPNAALTHAQKLLSDGASVLDLGGMSTRPGAATVSPDEELRRVLPVLRRLTERLSVPISVDTFRAEIARQAVLAGAEIVNDISGGLFDSRMAATCAECGVAVCLGHLRGNEQTYHELIRTDDIVQTVHDDLARRRDAFLAAGVEPERICLDPGIGFGKSAEQNVALLENIGALFDLGAPILVGHSRKRFLGGGTIEERDKKTAVWSVRLAASGVDLLRVHIIDPRKTA